MIEIELQQSLMDWGLQPSSTYLGENLAIESSAATDRKQERLDDG
jgi:hypothetical protein